MTTAHRLRCSPALLALLPALTFAACGDDASGSLPAQRPVTVEESLSAFGIDVAATPRVDEDADALPEDYAPFGAAQSFDTLEELIVIGPRLAPSFGIDGEVTVLEQVPDASNEFTTRVIGALAPEDTPWAASVGAEPTSLRAAVGGDVDADGQDELVIVSRDMTTETVELVLVEDRTMDFTLAAPVTIAEGAPREIEVVAGDFDGDGRGEVAVALSFDERADILFLENVAGALQPSGTTLTLPRASPTGVVSVAMAAGNLDRDNPWELAVVLNETFRRMDGEETGAASWFVIDDESTGFDRLAMYEPVRVEVGMTTRTAVTADVTVGDFDADGVDEIVFAGLTYFEPGTTCIYEYALLALDDAKRDLAPLGSLLSERQPFGRCGGGVIRTVEVDALDFDGDGALELHANEMLFEDFRNGAPFTEIPVDVEDDPGATLGIPPDVLFGGSRETGLEGRFDRDTVAFAVGDVTQDTRQDLSVLSEATGGRAVRVWGLDMLALPCPVGFGIPEGCWQEIVATEVVAPVEGPGRPLLLAANLDQDSLALQYSEGTYQLVFTEPVLLAALAAPPCDEALGQNLDACRTAFGTSESMTVETEFTWTVTAGVAVGIDTSFSVFGVEVSAFEAVTTIKGSYARSSATAYTLTQRVEYETGPNEDGVIFTSVPYDQYTYEIVSHPDPQLIGAPIVISLPREPITVLVEPSFYNANITEDGIPIDADVFQHVPGDLRSYPTVAERDAIQQMFPRGFATRQVDVGQGGGSVTVGVNVFEETSSATAYGAEAELAVQATAAGVVLGFSVGGGVEDTLRISHGAESDYAGTVAGMSSEAFAENAFRFGLFTYVHEHPQQEFEVLNYWVDR